MGIFGSTETAVLYCFHNDIGNSHVTFYDECGEVETMSFGSWVSGDDKWDAMNRLMFPYKDDGSLKDGVEYASDDEMWQTK